MKGFNFAFTVVIAVILAIFAVSNVMYLFSDTDDNNRPYRVEASRLEHKIKTGGYENINIENCLYITNIEKLTKDNEDVFYSGNSSDYLVKQIDGELYRFDYSYQNSNEKNIIILNISLGIMALTIIGIMIFLRIKVIQPFNVLKNIPYELSKGNLAVPLKENKNKYFGNFVWGMDLLREHLEEKKINELKLQKEKKTLILSISHDIKTPLGVIELYAKALEKDLYKDECKKKEIAISITEKCNEIKKYVSEIIKASSEDFLDLQVNIEEFYLSDMINAVNTFYKEKLDLMNVDFSVGKYVNYVVKGDMDRGIEVLQNITENALKYGDGKEISILFEQEEDCILITIQNSGCTLSENEIPHIFDSFWRGSNVGSNSGSGLGLYICRQLMRKMDGDIFARSLDGYMRVTAVFRIA